MSYIPRVRLARVGGKLQDPFDFLAEELSPPPLLSDDEVALILAHNPPENLIINMDKQSNGEYLPTNLIFRSFR